MKNTKLNEEKMKKVIDKLFLKEMLGINVYDDINNYPQFCPLIDRLRASIYQMMCYIFEGNIEHCGAKEVALQEIEELEKELLKIPEYKSSKLFKKFF